ncbi:MULTISPECIES: 5' nucleotidase, NT5C type [Sphingomonas]|uniref:5' nucleotidase, NT5C type n=1 Tax=Sphingomonas TaxID=13687 RepID=UPI001F073FCD|nr:MULTISPECIES: hypothetical protein [Sphingomonas]
MSEPHLFLDCDGVLADFKAGAAKALGMSLAAFDAKHGPNRFWRKLAQFPDFYASLPLMPDAMVLFDGVKHLKPTILTGMPLGNWAAPQKVAWAAAHFPGVPIITCMARDKYRHMTGADVLVDDMLRHRDKWEDAGGIFVHHHDARTSLAVLAQIYPSVKAPA